MMENTAHEGNLFQVVDCFLTARFSSLFANFNTPGVARARSRRGIPARLMAPPGGDPGDEGKESYSASGQPGSPGDQKRDLPGAAGQRCEVLRQLGLAGTQTSGWLCRLRWLPGLRLGTLTWVRGPLDCELLVGWKGP